jgi:hypothetical protein
MSIYFIWALLFAAFSSGSVLQTVPSGKKLEGVKLASSATFQKKTLQPVGAGLRYKKVLFIKAKVYVGQIFSDHPEAFVRKQEGALSSLEKSSALAVQMTFLRDVSAKQVEGAFREGFEENGVSLKDPAIGRFLEAVKAGSGAPEGKTLLVAAEREKDSEKVTYEDAEGKATTVDGGAGFIRNVFSLWLGKATDSGLESFQEEVLSK